MKEKYEEAEVVIVEFDTEDIITSSACPNEGEGYDPFG